MDQGVEINIKDLLFILKKHLKFILFVTILATLAGFLVSRFILHPKYEATATLIVNASTTTTNTQGLTYNDVDLSQKLVDTYAIVMKSNTILDQVIKDLSLDIDVKTLANNISVEGVGTTEVMDLVVADTNPDRAKAIASDIIQLAPKEIIRTVKAGSVEIISPAKTDRTPISPNVRLNTLVAALLGLVFSYGLSFLRELLNDKFRTDEDVHKKIGFTVIGVIPDITKIDEKRGYGK
ncbi:MAG TPA: Wzz/FepE/Etk N-terminal domain-containing protein [Clostridia bacterium]|nr:Wzz/FepE/Etk N-terminal domain-containing protein [Clostridia bacterium]